METIKGVYISVFLLLLASEIGGAFILGWKGYKEAYKEAMKYYWFWPAMIFFFTLWPLKIIASLIKYYITKREVSKFVKRVNDLKLAELPPIENFKLPPMEREVDRSDNYVLLCRMETLDDMSQSHIHVIKCLACDRCPSGGDPEMVDNVFWKHTNHEMPCASCCELKIVG